MNGSKAGAMRSAWGPAKPDGTGKTDAKDAYSSVDLLRQGPWFLPVDRAPAVPAAYRLRQRSMAWKKRVSHLRNHRRAALHLAFPALQPLMKDLPQPTAVRFFQAKPSPESLLRHGLENQHRLDEDRHGARFM
jgi:hypothetical protein